MTTRPPLCGSSTKLPTGSRDSRPSWESVVLNPYLESVANGQHSSSNSSNWTKDVSRETQDGNEAPLALPAGWRLHIITLSLCLSVFLSSLEVTIVSTSLVSISNDLQGFSQSSWLVTVYLVNYTGFMIIFAKLSDIFGRKLMMTTAVIIFTISSGACGAAQTMVQLIVLRAFQGIGGSGIYSMTMVIVPEMVPIERYPLYTTIVSSTFALAFLLGPLVGGVINDNTTWRWVFILNVPAGLVALVVLVVAIPANFLRQPSHSSSSIWQKFSKNSLLRVDFQGFFLLLSASVLLITALGEGGIRYEWHSPLMTTFLVLSGLLWITFFVWEWTLSKKKKSQEPVLPWEFLKDRIIVGMLIAAFLVGFPFTVAVIEIAQRLQTVNGVSAFGAGYRLLPLALGTPIGAGIAGNLFSKHKFAPLYILIVGTILQTTGLALMSTLPTVGQAVSPAQYGYEFLAGFGTGINTGLLVLATPFAVAKKHHAVAMGAMNQFRLLGGAIGIGVSTNVLHHWIQSRLSSALSAAQLDGIFHSSHAIEGLGPGLQALVRTVFAEGYNLQMRITIGISAAQLFAALLMWERKPTRWS